MGQNSRDTGANVFAADDCGLPDFNSRYISNRIERA
jgi:hypothetical protein